MVDHRTTTINDIDYQIGELAPLKQLNVLRRLAPLLAQMGVAAKLLKAAGFIKDPKESPEGEEVKVDSPDRAIDLIATAAGPLAEAFAKMTDDDVEYVVKTCLTVVERKQERGWAPVVRSGQFMFADMGPDTMLQLSYEVIANNLQSFFRSRQPSSA